MVGVIWIGQYVLSLDGSSLVSLCFYAIPQFHGRLRNSKWPVTRSSVEAEYLSITSITCELKWLKGFLLSFVVPIHRGFFFLFCDTKYTLHMTYNPMFHEQTKHIEVNCHFVRDAIQNGLISPF